MVHLSFKIAINLEYISFIKCQSLFSLFLFYSYNRFQTIQYKSYSKILVCVCKDKIQYLKHQMWPSCAFNKCMILSLFIRGVD